MSTFILKPITKETAKIGNTVFNTSYGFGEIHHISPDESIQYRVYVRFPVYRDGSSNGVTAVFTTDGRNEYEDSCPTLFYVPSMINKNYTINTVEAFVKIKADAIETKI